MTKRLAIIGAGPIGIEAATLATKKGWDVTVYEQASPGASIQRWRHVRLFSPWSLNRSVWGAAELGTNVQEDTFPTGQQYLDSYLLPLAERLGERIKHKTRVLGIARRDALKGEFVGSRAGNTGPFLLHVDGIVERYEEAEVVFDTSGVYENPAGLGTGGLRALGESSVSERIERYIPDAMGADRAAYANKQILLVGAGHSAVTSLRILADLIEQEPKTQVYWAFRGDQAPYKLIENDSLPERYALGEFGNQAAVGAIHGITALPATTVKSVQGLDHRLTVTLTRSAGEETIEVDRIIANVGYRPNLSLSREIQVHQCYASEGPMKLAASLLASAGGDCLAQPSAGVDLLQSPEPNYFILGAKSYGRNSSFLLKLGFAQIKEVLESLSSAHTTGRLSV